MSSNYKVYWFRFDEPVSIGVREYDIRRNKCISLIRELDIGTVAEGQDMIGRFFSFDSHRDAVRFKMQLV